MQKVLWHILFSLFDLAKQVFLNRLSKIWGYIGLVLAHSKFMPKHMPLIILIQAHFPAS